MNRRLFLSTFVWAAAGQETRQLWVPEFLEKRPPTAKSGPKPGVEYKSATPSQKPETPVSGTAQVTTVGITFWRVLPASSADVAGSRLLILEPPGIAKGQSDRRAGKYPAEAVPKRIQMGTPLRDGDKIRISVEVPRFGYLYVINREQYADGSLSAPYLIYPNALTHGGDNVTAPGRLIDIPDYRDVPNCFTVRSKDGKDIIELLFFLLVPQPLDLQPDKSFDESKPLELALFNEWKNKWGVEANRFDLAKGSGNAWTQSEKQAGMRSARLTQADAMPQTLYRIIAERGRPIMLEVPLRILTVSDK